MGTYMMERGALPPADIRQLLPHAALLRHLAFAKQILPWLSPEDPARNAVRNALRNL